MGGFREGFNTKLEEKRVKQENEQFHFFYDELVQVEEFDSLSYLSVMKKLMKKEEQKESVARLHPLLALARKSLNFLKPMYKILEQFKQKELSESGI